jgi:hypothetical protein
VLGLRRWRRKVGEPVSDVDGDEVSFGSPGAVVRIGDGVYCAVNQLVRVAFLVLLKW